MLRLLEGWENVNSVADILMTWTGANSTGSFVISAGQGRRGSNALHNDSSNRHIETPILAMSGDTFILGFAYRVNTVTSGGSLSNTLWDFGDATVTHAVLGISSRGAITITLSNGSAGPFSSADEVIVNQREVYLEVKMKIANSGGTLEVRLNGNPTPIISQTGLDTQNGGTAQCTRFRLRCLNGVFPLNYWDDIYICDGSGSFNNDFKGDTRVDCSFMSTEGNYAQSTPSAGSDRSDTVDDTDMNGDTDYNTIVTVGHKDSFVHEGFKGTDGSDIWGFQTRLYARKTDSGTGDARSFVRSGGADFNGTSTPLASAAYICLREIFDTDPNTGAKITEANYESLEPGYERTA